MHISDGSRQLIIDGISLIDMGQYLCRMDPNGSATANVSVVVHPDVVVIDNSPPNGSGLANDYVQIGLMLMALVIISPSIIYVSQWRNEAIEAKISVDEMKAAMLSYRVAPVSACNA